LARTEHWQRIECPVLLLSGESDPFAKIDLLRTAVDLLPNAELVTWPKLGHTLKPVLDEALDRVAAFMAALPGAG
jgi:pimeloyl-ACP methyl ester carboxylesterase